MQEILLLTCEDKLLAHPPEQPKAAIAGLIDKGLADVKVPRRFHSLSEAVSTVPSIIIRSEHPLEYYGPSGLFDSYILDITRYKPGSTERGGGGDISREYAVNKYILDQMGKTSDEEIFDYLRKLNTQAAEQYYQLTNSYDNQDSILEDLSYSIWEYIEGYNCSIVADTGISGRYHMFITRHGSDGQMHNKYFVIDDNMTRDGHNSIAEALFRDFKLQVTDVIDFYEAVRGMSCFDKRHSPIIEFQISDLGEIFFLQYHRAQDKIAINKPFVLRDKPRKDELEATFVRGATGPYGLEVELVMYNYYMGKTVSIDYTEEAAHGMWNNKIFSDLMSRYRILNVVFKDADWFVRELTQNHFEKSIVFKPEIFVALPPEAFEEMGYANLISRFAHIMRERGVSEEGIIRHLSNRIRIPVRVVSDGQRSFVRFLKTEDELLRELIGGYSD